MASMPTTREDWKRLVSRLELESKESLDSLQQFIYPIEDLTHQDLEAFLDTLLTTPTLHTPELIPKWSQLLHNLIKFQRLTPPTDIAFKLFHMLLTLQSTCTDPTEPLYALSSIVRYANLTPKFCEGLLARGSPLLSVALSNKSIPVRRACLDCIISIVQHVEISPLVLNEQLETLFELLNSCVFSSVTIQSILHMKLQLSLLRCFHQMLEHMGSLQPLPLLPSLLAMLKVAMTTGLPGHTLPRALLPLKPHANIVSIDSGYQSVSVAGPRQKRGRKKPRPTFHQQDHASSTCVDEGYDVTSEGGSETRLVMYSVTSSSSESELSDSDVASVSFKDVNQKVRARALNCLSTIFQSLDKNSAFSYGLPFLPDSPRPPSSPPTLLTCLCKDPSHRCRSSAAAVLVSILEGSKSYLAAANDQPIGYRPFTPYSTLLGNVVKELHRTLLLSVTAEPHPTTLTQVIKCLSVLISNVPYYQLSNQYISRILTTIQPIAIRQDIDVAVGCLTCYGALLSLTNPHREVEIWLKEETPTGWPWIVQHCVQLLENDTTGLSLVMESIQVITAVVKFHFSVIKTKWQKLSDLYVKHLSDKLEPIQPHALKFLEELGRILSTELDQNKELSLSDVTTHWEGLLSGPLVHWLQQSQTYPATCSHSCSVLAVIGNKVFQNLKSGSIRTLGIFCQYSCLSDDMNFLLDCSERITKGCTITEQLAIRTQASWSLGNLTDSLATDPTRKDSIPYLFPMLSKCIASTMKDIEKVKVNAVRAAGNLLRVLTSEIFEGCGSHVTEMVSLLGSSVNVGIMKTRWNACYACHNAFSNESFLEHCDMIPIVNELCTAVVSCKNFKVRTNAALALGSPSHYPTSSVLKSVWVTILKGIELSDVSHDFTEYKQTDLLRQQLCQTFCKLILLMSDDVIINSCCPSAAVINILQQSIQQIVGSTCVNEKGNVVQLAIKKLELFNSHKSQTDNEDESCSQPDSVKLVLSVLRNAGPNY